MWVLRGNLNNLVSSDKRKPLVCLPWRKTKVFRLIIDLNFPISGRIFNYLCSRLIVRKTSAWCSAVYWKGSVCRRQRLFHILTCLRGHSANVLNIPMWIMQMSITINSCLCPFHINYTHPRWNPYVFKWSYMNAQYARHFPIAKRSTNPIWDFQNAASTNQNRHCALFDSRLFSATLHMIICKSLAKYNKYKIVKWNKPVSVPTGRWSLPKRNLFSPTTWTPL